MSTFASGGLLATARSFGGDVIAMQETKRETIRDGITGKETGLWKQK